MAIIKIVRDLKQGCKCIPLRLGVLFVSVFVALSVTVGLKTTAMFAYYAQIKAHLGKPGIGIGCAGYLGRPFKK